MEQYIKRDNLEAYSIDESIFRVTPSGVCTPQGAKDIQTLVRMSTEKRGDISYSLTARAGGTCMSGGPLNEGIILDMSAMAEIISFDEETKRMWVQPGAYYRDVETYLLPYKLMYAPYTSSKDICCIGGMVANNASGEKSFRYGTNRENVRSIRMVCADGQEYTFGPRTDAEMDEVCAQDTWEGKLYRTMRELYNAHEETFKEIYPNVRKNVAGYALNAIYIKETGEWNIAKLLAGSQGTLGIMTAIELELADIRPYSAVYAVPIDTFANVPDILDEVTKEVPDTVEVYDNMTLSLACKENKATEKVLGHLLPYRAILIVEYTALTEESLKAKADRFEEVCREKGVAYEGPLTPDIAGHHWEARRSSYRLFTRNVTSGTAVPIIEDISVERKALDSLFDELDAVMKKYEFPYVFHGHIADGSIRVFPVVDFTKKEAVRNLLAATEEIFTIVVAKGGTISTDHNDGIVRTPFLPLQFTNDSLTLFQAVKNAFDPHNIFNPRKKVGGTRKHLVRAIKKELSPKTWWQRLFV